MGEKRRRETSVLSIAPIIVAGLLGHAAMIGLRAKTSVPDLGIPGFTRYLAWLAFVPWCAWLALLLFRSSRIRWITLPIILIVAVVLSAGTEEVIDAYGDEVRQARTFAQFPLGTRFPSLELQDLTGHDAKLNPEDEPFLLVNFWRTWCVPCVNELPVLSRLDATPRVTVVGLNSEEVELQKQFCETHDVTFSTLKYAEEALDVNQFPVSVLVDRTGNIRRVWVGPVEEPEVLAHAKGS